jgi:uncharacterized protein (TIGR02147 family)
MEYRHLLQAELLDRIRRNPSYSIRAMSRDVGLSPAFYSQVLSGKRELSESKGVSLATRLGWTAQQSRIFLQLIRLRKTSDPGLRKELLSQLQEEKASDQVIRHFSLSAKRFAVVSDWYHFAILELTELKGFRTEPAWIARKLGISPLEVELAIERLTDLGLLSLRDGKLEKEKNCSIGDIPSEAIRKFHRQNIERAARALKAQPFEQRHVSGTTMAIDSRRLPLAIKRINRFRQELMKELEQGERNHVYQLNVQLFRLTQEDES